MHGSTKANAGLVAALHAAPGVQTALCVPYPYLAQLQQLLAGSTDLLLGAQDLSEHSEGAYTGEVSAAMLKEFGVQVVIVGHCERRRYHADTSEAVARKALAAIRAGLRPVVCVGETLAEREDGRTFAILAQQMTPVAQTLASEDWAKVIVAYEPVWAIGTGKTASPEHAQEAHEVLRKVIGRYDAAAALQVPILYGGSVRAANAHEIFAMPDVDGGLVGGASLNAEEFNTIAAAAAY